MPFCDSGGIRIYYDDRGHGEPVFVCLAGFWLTHRMFAPLAERLAEDHRILGVDWRGHGRSDVPNGDSGFLELVDDVVAVVRDSGAQSVIPIAQAHSGWVALELRHRLGDRVPKIVHTSWNPILTEENPLAAPFLAAMETLQDPDRWRDAREQLLTLWLGGAPASVSEVVRGDIEWYGQEPWVLAGNEILVAYARHGDPLRALANVDPPVPALHVYAQPRAAEYLAAQESFAAEHPWFSVHRLDGISHFPTMEVPDETAVVVRAFADR